MIKSKKPVRIFGAGVRAAIAVDLIAWEFADSVRVEGFYDDRLEPSSKGPGGYPILGSTTQGLDEAPQSAASVFIAIGTLYSARAAEFFITLRNAGVEFLRLASPSARISPSAQIGDNALILPGGFVGCGVQIGHLVCMHGGAIIEHHSSVGNSVLLAPGVATASYATIGSYCFIGVGCKIISSVSIGRGSLLGAGAIVVCEIPPHTIAYGQPAVPRRGVREGDEVPTPEQIKHLEGLGLP
jgi:sugar O-acyltransferase (sialic acid O-acetyltransferase NeuD family)